MIFLFSFTLFISAFLLFWVQLMVAKMILPLLGGAPSVWNTCLFFFQAALLLGYGYSHLTTSWFSVRRQAIIHSILLLVPLGFLPISVAKSWVPPQEANPIPWLLALLLFSVGLPFFVVATSAPLVQKWFADTGHPASSDPYFLYTASNLGSMLGVLSYPILIEPNFSLTQQSWLWAIAYGLLALSTLVCAVFLWRSPEEGDKSFPQPISNKIPLSFPGWRGWGADKGKSEEEELNNLAQNSKFITPNSFLPPTIQQQTQWVLLSFLPSSLLLGVTTYLTTDIAAIPLLWAIPLAIYLLTFILTFARNPTLPHNLFGAILPVFLAILTILFLIQVMQPIWVLFPLHLLGFFVAACVLHGELARSRPTTKYLTNFYLWISVGGVLGGLFNAIAAPLLFQSVLEYPLIMILSLLLWQTQKDADDSLSSLQRRFTFPISLGLLIGTLLVGFSGNHVTSNLLGNFLAFSLLIIIFYSFNLHPIRLIIGLFLIFLISQFSIGSLGGILDTERSFFGVYRVLNDRRGDYHSLLHGTILHGKQSLTPERRHEPLTYFHPTGPIGQLFKSFNTNKHPSRVAVLGLGVGTLAAYSEPGQQWTFYEIDPTVEKLARDTRYFTFLQDSKAPLSVVLGDARSRFSEASDNTYDLIFMDAFSSDSVPIHLITREAIQLYLSKLTKDGLIVINISNRFLNLEPVLGALAQDLGLSTLRQREVNISEYEREIGKSPSHWVLFARNERDFGNLINDSRWQSIPQTKPVPVWTDDFSNIFRVLRAFGA
ncbi:fused MFS/spermidine synthase [Trichocoleus sp. FACHB-90]|nr:fused MFS/spermidine synthase [Trichocoleus sp. FACHB-90]